MVDKVESADSIDTRIAAFSEQDPRFVELIESLKPFIRMVQAEPARTMNHYDSWMQIIGGLNNEGPDHATLTAIALIGAGAEREGVKAAYRLITGKEL